MIIVNTSTTILATSHVKILPQVEESYQKWK